MTALTRSRARLIERVTYKLFPLQSGTKAFKGGSAVLDTTTGKVRPATASDASSAWSIGVFDRDRDATAGELLVNVNFGMEREFEWLVNDATAPITRAGQLAYFVDDQTVGLNGGALAGRVWDVQSDKGVCIERYIHGAGGVAAGGASTAAPAFASNDSAIPASAASDTTFAIPATAAASTITLPAGAREGTRLRFAANGTANAHTVQYRDGANGNAAITTALTAAKRHYVFTEFIGGAWVANADVSP